MVFYSDFFVKDGFAGTTYGPVIFIRPKYRGDAGLLVHEQTHVRQFWKHFPLFALRYRFSLDYRLKYEAEAYAAQAKCYVDDRVPLFAKYLSEKYGMGISVAVAEGAIREWVAL